MRSSGDGVRLPERYEWKSLAGRGGMGVVHRAADRRTGAEVAVKVLHARGTVEMARFEQEAKVLAELSHPAIVRYFDHGVTPDGAPYIAMEWLEGETLEERLVHGRLEPADVAHIAHRVLAALAAAHGRDIVHRDIKPGNIFLVDRKLDDIRILDFGIARRRLDIKRFTREGATVGTPLYTSPEQARGRADVDGRADIFSLGCVLFEALAGEPPFTGDSPLEVMTRVCSGRAANLDLKRPGLPLGVSALVRSMLAPEPAARPQSAAALAEDFARHAAVEATTAVTSPAARPAPAATEQRLVSAMLVSRGKAARPEANAFAAGLRRLAESHGCVLDLLVDRSFLLTSSTAAVEDQAAGLASLALAVRDFDGSARMAIATGRTAVIGHLPVGPLMERLPLMLKAPEAGAIRIDSTTQQLLPAVFQVAPVHSGFLLLSPRQAAGALPQDQADDDDSEPSTPTPLPHRAHPSITDG